MSLKAITSFMCVFVLAFAAYASAEGEQQAEPENQQGEKAEKPQQEKANAIPEEDLRDMVSTIMMVRVSRSLELTDEQTVIMVKHMQEMREEMSKLYRERDESMKALRELSEKADATDDEINTKLSSLMSIDERRATAKRDAFEKISVGLNTKQKAKLYVTLQDFESQMRRMTQRAKEMDDDTIREKFQEWNRGEGVHGDRIKDIIIKNRRAGDGAESEGGKAKPAETPKP